MYKLVVKGIVQGVGFRPFVYRLATSIGLKGYVRNTGDGTVEIVIDSDRSGVNEFIRRLKAEKPPMSEINEVRVEEFEEDQNFQSFIIMESGGRKGELSLPPPDVAICKACHTELFNSADRRYLYPFTSCTDCGQRYSVAFRLPYDRENTTFRDFPLCQDCRKEYDDVGDRRYYAQSIACPKCGPSYKLAGGSFRIEGLEAVKKAAELLDAGEFLAIKGWGGFHIACLTEDDVVQELRALLRRPQQPFAIMARDVETVGEIALFTDKEKNDLMSHIRPIVVLRKKDAGQFTAVAPGLDTIGVMLPYSPLHHVLFSHLKADYLVMTSANKPGEPMYIDDSVKELVPTILTHNLAINRIDDSVVKVVGGERMIIRRSRGFVPNPVPVDSDVTAVAFGAELYNSIGFMKDGKAVLSQYIGDTSNFKTFHSFFKETVSFLQRFLNLEKPDVVFCDMHPLYNTSIFAERFAEDVGAELFRIQHHVAHGLSVMAERGLDEAVAIAVDGVGYGADGTIWGCEILHIDIREGVFQRLGRMEHIPLPGGDLAVRYPARALVGILSGFMGIEEIRNTLCSGALSRIPNLELVVNQVRKNINVAVGSSAGRYMDAASSLLDVCQERTYEGEPAMKLESFAKDTGLRFDAELLESREPSLFAVEGMEKSGTVRVIPVLEVFGTACEILRRGASRRGIAYAFIEYLARSVAEIALDAAWELSVEVVLSGGVAYNSHFTPLVRKQIGESAGVHVNRLVAAGDNGISFGQLYASKMLG